jgi:diguanylate cyclase (GGDEF)-like protein
VKDSPTKSVVLLVDDDPVVRMLMRQSLSTVELESYEASNGPEAIAAFEQYQPDLILLDVSMPGMDGFECCRKIRQLPHGKECAIVMITSLDGKGDRDIEHAFQVGATDFMPKPWKWPLFNHRVKYLLKSNHILRELSQNKNKLAKAQSIAHLVYWEWDPQSESIRCSADMFDMLGLPRQDKLTLKRLLSVVHPEDRGLLVGTVRAARNDKKPYDIEYRVQHADGRMVFVNERADISLEHGQWHINGTLQNITAFKQSEQEANYYAYYDTLTALPNRRLFIEHLKSTIADSGRDQQQIALMLVDLDRFKRINDTYGHHVGDDLLCQAANRIRECVCKLGGEAVLDDMEKDMRVARLGSDEFAILLDDAGNVKDIANCLIEAFSNPFMINGTPLYVSVSIGITGFSGDADNVQILLQHADVAMYHAKRTGRNNYQFFSEGMNDYLKLRTKMEQDLRIALEEQQFELYFQPQYRALSGEIVGFEALLRWHHPVKGLLMPNSFIEEAESTGLILQIGDWVLIEACQQVRQWQQEKGRPYRIAINLSALQFNQNYLPERIRQTLEQTQLPAETLELEITETAMLQDVAETVPLLHALKEIGVRLAIDDFGTGYSSMNYLKNFPIDTMKIDRSFVEDIVFSPKDAAIAQTIVQLARNLDLSTIAEGVETEAQARLLQKLGCEEFQGFYFSKPKPVAGINELLNRDVA